MQQFRTVTDDINRLSLAVYNHLLAVAEACAPAAPPFKNLAILFFHSLQQFFTAYLYCKIELAEGLVPSWLHDETSAGLPYWDYRNVRTGLDPDSYRYSAMPQPNRWGASRAGLALSEISRVIGFKGRTIGVLPGPLNALELGKAILSSGYRVCFPTLQAVGDTNFEQQWLLLVRSLDSVFDTLEMPSALRGSSVEILRREIQSRLTGVESKLSCDVLITGSLLTIEHRLQAARARAQGIPVITTVHGDADGFLDEPWSGYGEATYPTHILSFGQHGAELRNHSRYSRSIIGETPRTIPTSSQYILKKLWSSGRDIRHVHDLDTARILYIPTSYAQFSFYGPFRSAPDLLYEKWQLALQAAFPNMTVKEHPVNALRNKAISGPARKETRPLSEVILDYDFYMLDYVSSATSYALATDRPVVYFDLGIRNPTARMTQALQARCHYITPSSFDPATIRKEVLAQLDGTRSDAFTPDFSLCGDLRPRERILVKEIDHL